MFRRNREGDLILGDSQEARDVAAKNRTSRAPQSKRPELVHQKAVAAVMTSGGNTADRQAVLGQYHVQFGVYRGQTFRWMLEDCLGYSAWLANGMKGKISVWS